MSTNATRGPLSRLASGALTLAVIGFIYNAASVFQTPGAAPNFFYWFFNSAGGGIRPFVVWGPWVLLAVAIVAFVLGLVFSKGTAGAVAGAGANAQQQDWANQQQQWNQGQQPQSYVPPADPTAQQWTNQPGDAPQQFGQPHEPQSWNGQDANGYDPNGQQPDNPSTQR